MKPRVSLWSLVPLLACAALVGAGIAASEPARTRSIFPLHLEAGKRHLVDAEGKAFLLNGDTAWSLVAELTREEVDAYLEDRRRKGFNAILVNLIERRFATRAPANRYGEAPFTQPGDFSAPNERYFAHADYVVGKAAEKGILVLLAPAYLGYDGGGQGWYREMAANGASKLRGYGRYLGRRFRHFPNILWVHGGDFNPPDKALVREIALGILELDKRSLHTAHGAPETAALPYWSAEPWLSINNLYTRKPVFSAALEVYGQSEMPFLLIEGRYENEGGSEGSEHRVRVQAYHALLSGAMGHVFGNNPMWHFSGPGLYRTSQTWQESLDSPGARSMAHLKNLFASRAWWTLEPDAANALLTNGLGDGHERAVAARAADRSFAIAYLPSVRPLRIDLTRLAGPRVDARWLDPANGSYSEAAASPFPAVGVRTFRPAGPNSSGFGDWVLILVSRGER